MTSETVMTAPRALVMAVFLVAPLLLTVLLIGFLVKLKRRFRWANPIGILLVIFCGQEITRQLFGSTGASFGLGLIIINGYSLGLILLSMSVSLYLPPRLTERVYTLEAQIARLMAAPPPEGQTEFTVTLKDYPAERTIILVKVIRDITGLGIRETSDLIDAAPSTIKKGISKADAEAIVKRFDETGATVEIK